MDREGDALEDGAMYRLFVALSLPELAQDALTQLQSGLPGARWTPSENFHLTLCFVGETDRHGYAEIHSALSTIAAPSFDVKFSGCGFFGNGKPRALWVGAVPEPGLSRLQSKVSVALARVGFVSEKRKFAPHVTLAYLHGATVQDAAKFSAMHGLFSFGPFPVEAFHLYESRLGGEASHYEIVQSYPLSSSR